MQIIKTGGIIWDGQMNIIKKKGGKRKETDNLYGFRAKGTHRITIEVNHHIKSPTVIIRYKKCLKMYH